MVKLMFYAPLLPFHVWIGNGQGRFFTGIAALFCVFMWVGVKAFFTKGSVD